MEKLIIDALQERITHCLEGLYIISKGRDINVSDYGYDSPEHHFSITAFSSMLRVISSLKSGENFMELQLSKPELIQVLKAVSNYNTDAINEKWAVTDVIAEKLIVAFCERNDDKSCWD